jgi:F0F1-type ATP synthase delta subunit
MLKDTIKRKEDIEALVSCIDKHIKCIYCNNTLNYAEWGKYLWNKELSKLLESAQSSEDKLKILKGLKNDAQKIEIVLVSTQSGCSDRLVNEMIQKIQEQGINDIVIQCESDPKVVSGAHIYLKGRFIDATIRNRVANLLNHSDVLSKYI